MIGTGIGLGRRRWGLFHHAIFQDGSFARVCPVTGEALGWVGYLADERPAQGLPEITPFHGGGRVDRCKGR